VVAAIPDPPGDSHPDYAAPLALVERIRRLLDAVFRR
jgi:hypothetical protein